MKLKIKRSDLILDGDNFVKTTDCVILTDKIVKENRIYYNKTSLINILTKDVVKGAVWHSKKQLADQIISYVDTYNKERAKPFEWTYDGETKNSSSNLKSLH